MRPITYVRFLAAAVAALSLAALAPAGAQPDPQPTVEPAAGEWPREFDADNLHITIYQPQVESWNGDELLARAAVAVLPTGAESPDYGVMWFSSHTQTDKETNTVALDSCQITKSEFPSAPSKAEAYVAAVRAHLPEMTRPVSLSRLEAALEMTNAINQGRTQDLQNDPPRIVYSTKPALLVLVDGRPVLRAVPGSVLLRVVNTRALMLLDQDAGVYYVHVLGGWRSSRSMDGPWTTPASRAADLDRIADSFKDNPDVDLLDKEDDTVKASEDVTIYVRTEPAELIQTQGKADLAPIDGTQLLYVRNTVNQIFLYTPDQKYYVLISGRWFTGRALDTERWSFVDNDKLPADFAKIPEAHPGGAALASVAGTTQAQEAVIANSIPQTSEVNRAQATFTPAYDGAPKFDTVEGTSLQYATNCPTPIVQVDATNYYACENGVWFTAHAPLGTWVCATSVPAVIYTIPARCRIHYVTYVRVYRYTPEFVYVGYTPGYLGTVVTRSGCVVFGTGYHYRPYVGAVYISGPCTYGFGAGLAYGFDTGFAFGFTAGLVVGTTCHPGWGVYRGWHATRVHVYNHFSFNHYNVYRRWEGAATHVSRVGPRGRPAEHLPEHIDRRPGIEPGRPHNNVYAAPSGGIYRRTDQGWERHDDKGGWHPAETHPDWGRDRAPLGREETGRRAGELRSQTVQPQGTPRGGFEGGANRGGFHGGAAPAPTAHPTAPMARPTPPAPRPLPAGTPARPGGPAGGPGKHDGPGR